MSTTLDRAQNFSGGTVAAARQRDRWARAEANATDPEQREAYREAIADLEARYTDLEDIPVGGAEAYAKERGHGRGSRSPVHEGRRRRGSTSTRDTSPAPDKTSAAGRGSPRPIPGLTPGARRTSSQGRAAAVSPTPKIDRAIRQTGIPAAAGSSGSAIMSGLGITVGLSLFYLVITSAEIPGSGAEALPRMINGVTRFLGRFLSLEDIFPGPHTGVVAGATPMRETASPGEIARVEREADRLAGSKRHLPGEGTPAGIASGDLSNPAAELHPRRRRRRR